MARIICTTFVPGERFLWQEKGRVYTAEISDLPGDFHSTRIYDDAVDAGFTMTRNGKPATFYLQECHRDGEGDVTHWTYLPVTESIKEYPKLAGAKVVIFND